MAEFCATQQRQRSLIAFRLSEVRDQEACIDPGVPARWVAHLRADIRVRSEESLIATKREFLRRFAVAANKQRIAVISEDQIVEPG